MTLLIQSIFLSGEIILSTPAEREAIYLIPRLRDLAFSVDIRFPYSSHLFLIDYFILSYSSFFF